ncbi:hypothetical protein [Thiocapsa marina]|nr:hypothetical protein [Thiocapsa marina]
MKLFEETRTRLLWLLPLAKTIHRLTATQLIATVTIFIVGQVSLVTAMFLPLKAILLLASNGVPRYLSGFVTHETKDAFIVVLVIGALLAYGVYMLCERIIADQLRRGAARILAQNKKLWLFPNEQTLIRTHYLRFCRIVASVILFALATGLGFLVAPLVFSAVLVVVIFEYVLADRFLRRDSAFTAMIVKTFREDRSRFFTILANLNFLIGFVLLFAQFLSSDSRNVIIAILTFLLLRQMTNRLRLAVQDFIALSDDRYRINPLFHTNMRYAPPANRQQESFLQGMSLERRSLWIPDVLASVTGAKRTEIAQSLWNDTASLGIAAFDIRMRPGETKTYDFFLRCFSSTQQHLAEHEAKLFESPTPPSIAPRYLGRSMVGDSIVHVFKGLPAEQPTGPVFNRRLRKLLRACEQTPLSTDLRDSYLRTHRTLSQRLEAALIERLGLAVENAADREVLDFLRTTLPVISRDLASLPMVLDNSDLTRPFCRIDDEGNLIAWAWHRWKIDVHTARTLDTTEGKPLRLEPMTAIPEDLMYGDTARRILASRLLCLESASRRGMLREGLGIAREIRGMWERLSAPLECASTSE